MSKGKSSRRNTSRSAGKPQEVTDLEKTLPEVISELRSGKEETGIIKFNEFVRKVLQQIANGVNIDHVVRKLIIESEAVKNLPSKIWHPLLEACAHRDNEMGMMCTGLLMRKCNDVDPHVRAASLRTLGNLRIASLLEYLQNPILEALKDEHDAVRSAAVIAVHKVLDLDPEMAQSSGMLDTIKQLLRNDPSCDVRCNCVYVCLQKETEADLIADKSLVYNLLTSISLFRSFQQATILRLLSLYTPSNDAVGDQGVPEFAYFMEAVEPCLKSVDSSTTMAAVNALLKWTQNNELFFHEAIQTIRKPLYSIVHRGDDEIAYCALAHMLVLVRRSPYGFSDDCAVFFLRHVDAAYIKAIKLDILKHLATMETQSAVVAELLEYTKDRVSMVGQKAVQALGYIVLKLTSSEGLIEELLNLLGSGDPIIVSETMVQAKDILRRYPEVAHVFGPGLRAVEQVDLVSPESVAAYIWIRSMLDYMECFPDEEGVQPTPYMLEDYASRWEVLQRIEKLAIIDATVRVCFVRAPETLPVLRGVLKTALEDRDQLVKDAALLVYRSLGQGLDTARMLLVDSVPGDDPAEEVSTETAEEIYSEFNTLSVVYQKPARLFVDPDVYRHRTIVSEERVVTQEQAMTEAADVSLLEEDDLLGIDLLGKSNRTSEASGSTSTEPTGSALDDMNSLMSLGMNMSAALAPAQAPVLVVEWDRGAVMASDVYQMTYQRLPNACYFSAGLPAPLLQSSPPDYNAFNAHLSHAGIKVLAQGDPKNYRAFLYAKRVPEQTPVLILYETNLTGPSPVMTVTIRSPDASAAEDMKRQWDLSISSFK